VVSGFLVSFVLPEFPQLPAPNKSLSAEDKGALYFSSASPYDLQVILGGMEHALPTTGQGTLFLPDNATENNPVPAMVLLHGSGGISAGREMEYAQLLNSNGIAAFVIDYYSNRGVVKDSNYFAKVLSVTEFDALTDAYNALNLLATHPLIDSKRIGVMGFSYGGMAVKFAMDERIRKILSPNTNGFAAFADFYGTCFQQFNTTQVNGAPLITLRGTLDASNDLVLCAAREKAYRDLGVEVETHIYEGAGHAWENKQPFVMGDYPYLSGCEIVYDEKGHAMINNKIIVDVPVETPRVQRIGTRITSGYPLQSCVHQGYMMGRVDAVKQQSDQHLADFFRRHLRR